MQASFVEFFCKPSCNDAPNIFTGRNGIGRMVFDDGKRLIFHEITSKRTYEQTVPDMNADLFPQV